MNIADYLINIYRLDTEILDLNSIIKNMNIINNLQSPSEIVEYLQEINGVSKIEVLDADGNVLLNSFKIIT